MKIISVKPAVPINIVVQDEDGNEYSILGHLDCVNRVVNLQTPLEAGWHSLPCPPPHENNISQLVFDYLDNLHTNVSIAIPNPVQQYSSIQSSIFEKKTQLMENVQNGLRRNTPESQPEQPASSVEQDV